MSVWVVFAVVMMVVFFAALLFIAAGAAFMLLVLARHLVHEASELLGRHGRRETEVAGAPRGSLHT